MAKNFLRAISSAVRHDPAPEGAVAGSVIFDGAIDDVDVAGLVEVGRGPIGDIAVDGDSHTIVVTNPGTDCITVINPDTLGVVGSVRLDGAPFAVAVANDRAYVSTSAAGHDAIVEVDTVTGIVLAEYPLAFSVTALAVSPDGKRVFAGRTGHGRIDIAVIDTMAERVGTIDIATGTGVNLDALRVDATGKWLFAATADVRGSRLVAINAETTQIEATVWIGAPIRDLALGSGDIAYVLTSDREHRGVVRIVDLAAGTIIGAVDVGGAPTQLVFSPEASRAYIVDYDRVSVLSTLTNEVIGSVDVNAQPAAVTVRPDGGRLYIADYTGHVNVFASTAVALPALYSPVAATELVAAQPRAELQPAGV